MRIRSDLFVGILPFVRAAEERSFGRAAASLGVTTAAISKAVAKLEDDLGVRLLERSSRVVALTREGEEFLARCQQAVLGVQGARATVEGTRREPRGEVSITLPFIVAPFVVPNLGRLVAQYPRLSFRLDVSDRVALIAGESYDVAIRMGALEDSTLVARLLRRTRWVTVASPSYLARHPAPRRPEDLAEHNGLRFVGPSGRAREWSFVDGTRALAIAVKGNLTIDHGAYLLTAAESGMGVCQVLDFMVEDGLTAGRLVELLPAFSARGPNIHAVSTAARASSANVRAFGRFLGEVFAPERS
ncbi:LysR family transcriptional regulator [soil metagenome]